MGSRVTSVSRPMPMSSSSVGTKDTDLLVPLVLGTSTDLCLDFQATIVGNDSCRPLLAWVTLTEVVQCYHGTLIRLNPHQHNLGQGDVQCY